MILSAGGDENFKNATPIGIGLIDSAINLTSLILQNRPEFLLFIGSAGSYGNYKIFDIVKSNIASNIEISFLHNLSYTPIDNVVKSIGDKNRQKDQNIVNCSNYITTDEESSKKFLKLNIEIENMEFYSVLKVAQKFKIPAMGIFVITNYCNKNAHSDFMTNHKEAMEILIKKLLKI